MARKLGRDIVPGDVVVIRPHAAAPRTHHKVTEIVGQTTNCYGMALVIVRLSHGGIVRLGADQTQEVCGR